MTLYSDSGGSPEDRRAEADRLINMLEDCQDQMTAWELSFVESLADGNVSPKQIYKLRDIRDKYL